MPGFFNHLFHAEFAAAWNDIVLGFQKLPQPVQDFIRKLGTDEGQLIIRLAEAELPALIAAGFTTASFVQAGKNIVSNALAQGKTVAISEAMAQINILAAPVNIPAA